MKILRWFAAVICVNVSVAVAQGAAEFTEPGWFRSVSKSATQHGALDRSHEGEPRVEGKGAGPLSLVSYPEIAEAITPEIQALARGLENNPANIFNYIDVYQQLSGIFPASGNRTNDVARSDRVFDLENYFGSAAEHGLIEQLQSSNLVAASTLKMLQIGNTNGQRTYLVHSGNWSGIQGSLINYDKNSLKTNYIDRGYSLLLPANGSNRLAGAGSWAGYGLVARLATSTNYSMRMEISGKYNGGFVVYPTVTPSPPFVAASANAQPGSILSGSALTEPEFGGDPVNMADGSFHLSSLDLSVGQREPRGIAFSRYYSSSRRHHHLCGLAHGWVHNYFVKAAEVSAPLPALGDTTPAQMAALIVATKSALELYQTAGNPKNWAVAALIAKWGVDQMINNGVSVTMGDGMIQLIEQYSQGDPSQTWRLFWSGFWNVEQDPAGGKRRFIYDEKHRLIQTQDALNHRTALVYDGQDHVLRTFSEMLARTDYDYDGRHNLVWINDPNGEQKEFFYDARDNLVRVRDERGHNSYFGYNAKFQLTGSTNGAGDWTTFVYNAADGTLLSRTDPGGTTGYGYDAFGQLNRTTYPGGLGSEGTLNNSLGDVLSRTNARGFVSSFQYNRRRELTNVIAPTNVTAQVAYDAAGNVARTTDARGFITSNAWSATRKLLTTTLPGTPQGTPVVTNAYDLRDWLARSLDPLQKETRFTNDAAQRLVSVTDPLNRTTRFGYDHDNRKIATTNAAHEVTRQTWNPRGELIQVTTPVSTTIKRSYDAAGNQITLTNRNGKEWQFLFDAANRLTNTLTPLGREARVTYDARGLVSSVREPSAQTTTNFYDAKGRLTNSADAVASRVFRYDANNNITNIIENGRTNTWTFDAYDRATSYRDADGYVIQYRYDANGNLTNLVYPGNRVVAYAYDSLNRLTNVTDWANRKTAIEYDLAGRVKKLTRPNHTVREIHYDAAGQTTNIWERLTNGTPIALFKLNWNANATVQWEFAAPLPHPHTPPPRTMTFDDDNRLATFNGQAVTHDLDGNLTSGPLTNATFSAYYYDARNRLSAIGALAYAYDPSGNRTALTNGTNAARLVINPNAALSQVLMRVSGGVTNYYIYGLGLLYEITETAGSTNTATYHYDYRGSTVALTDGNGKVTDRVEYSPYATTTYRSGTNETPFLYNGRYGVQTDPSGLLYMRARYYNPFLCRFINADPSGFAGGLNFYAYADGNPVSMMDPFGLGAGEVGGRSWMITPSSVFGWAYDQVHDLAATVTGLAIETLGAVVDLVGAGAGNPYLGEGLRGWGQDFYNMRSPAAQAGYYDPSHPVTHFATAATIFLNPGAPAASATARTFTSTDPLVANLANKIESLYPGHVVGVNVPLRDAAGNLMTDADILLRNSVLQVKSGGSAQGLLRQLQRSEGATGLPSIGFGPILPPNSLRTLSQQGGLVTRDENLLLQVIKP